MAEGLLGGVLSDDHDKPCTYEVRRGVEVHAELDAAQGSTSNNGEVYDSNQASPERTVATGGRGSGSDIPQFRTSHSGG